jgi:hypothetical protein
LEEYHFFSNADILATEIDNPISNLPWRNICSLSIEWCQWCSIFMHIPSTPGTLPSVAVLKLCVVLTDAYFVKVPCSWHPLIYSDYIVLQLKFEGGLATSILRNRATFYKILGSKPRSFQKWNFNSSQIFQTSPWAINGKGSTTLC